MAAALPTPPPMPQRDEEFYCRDVIFQVESTLFKVSRRPFEEDSEVFGGMFQLPPTDHPSGEEGTSDANPIHLPGVTEDEFRALLHVIFPATSATRLTKDRWMAALKLADMWSFDGVREKAVVELRRLVPSSAERVSLARRFTIAGWLEPALRELCQADALGAAELQALGWPTVAKLMQVRESVQFTGCACACNYCSYVHGNVPGQPANPGAIGPPRTGVVSAASVRKTMDFTSRIREVFGDELF